MEDGSLPSVLRDIRNNRVHGIRRHREEKDMVDVMKERIKEDRLENAKKMIADGNIPIEKIAYFQGLPLSEVQRIAEEMNVQPDSERE